MNDFKARRLLAGISQAELAGKIGCDQTTIGRIEKGGKASPVLIRAVDAALPQSCAAPDSGVRENSGVYTLKTPDSTSLAADAVADKIRLLSEIIESQRQTIEAQKLTIEAMQKRLGDESAPPVCGADAGASKPERKQA